MEKLIQLLNVISLMSPGLQAHLSNTLRSRVIRKGEFILRPGQICTNICFIEKGLIRIFHDRGNKEVITWLLKEGDIFISIDSFFDQVPSTEYIEALEDTIVWYISFAELEETCRQYPEFLAHQDKIKTKYHKINDHNKKRILGMQPKDRYKLLMGEEPELITRVPALHLASYLNISPKKLFGMRRDIAHGK